MKESEFQVKTTVDDSGRIRIECSPDILPGFPYKLRINVMNCLANLEYEWNEFH